MTPTVPDAELLALLRDAPAALVAARVSDRCVLFVSNRMTDLVGWAPEDLEGGAADRVDVIADPEAFEVALAQVVAEGGARDFALDLVHRDGSRVVTLCDVVCLARGDEQLLLAVYRLAGERDRVQRILADVAGVADVTLWEADLARGLTERFTPWGRQVGPNDRFLQQIVHADRAPMRLAVEGSIRQGASDYAVQVREARPDGSVRPVRIHARVHRDGAGRPVRLSGINTGVPLEARPEANHTEQFLGVFVDELDLMVVALDAQGHVRLFNRAAERLTGWPAAQVMHRSWFETLVPGDEFPEVLATFDASQGGAMVTEFENAVVCRDGRRRHIHWRNTSLKTQGDWLVVCVGIDVTDRRAAEADLRRQVGQDALTGLLSRSGILGQLRKELARLARRGGRLAVHMLDLDGFKAINDAHGHPTGDKALCAVADRLRRVVRAEDSVARLSGDEFVVLQVDPEPGQAGNLAERLVQQIAQPFDVGALRLSLGTSVGVATSVAGRGEPEQLLAQADAALYRAKRDGKGRFVMHDARLAAAHAERVELLRTLDGALAGGGVPVHWQPLVRLADGALVGLEALARWPGPEAVSALRVIRMATESGRIDAVGLAVRAGALREALGWRSRGLDVPVVSVNLSAAELGDRGLVDRMQGMLVGLAWPSNRLELDLPPEVWGAEDPPLATLEALAGLGVRLALDDVGLGLLPAAILRALPVARVKLHQGFLAAGGPSPFDVAVVEALVALAHAAGAQVVAEGVETAAQAQWVAERGCDLAQGYHFGAPALGHLIASTLRSAP